MTGIKFTNFWIVFIIFIAHFFAPDGYLFYQHTMSELAGQGVPNAWILTTGFFTGGLGYMIFSVYYRSKKIMPLWLFYITFANGLMTLLLGAFPTSFDELLSVSVNETIVIIHRYIAYGSNALTIAGMIGHIYVSKSPKVKIVHGYFIVFAIVFSGFFVLYDQDIRGVFQRLILLITTSWTLLYYGEFITIKRHLRPRIKTLLRLLRSR
jgi:hypothetical membrane protein